MRSTRKPRNAQEQIRLFESTFRQASRVGWQIAKGDDYEEEEESAEPDVNADDEDMGHGEGDDNVFGHMEDNSAIPNDISKTVKVGNITNDLEWIKNDNNRVSRMRKLCERLQAEAEASGNQDDEIDLSVSTNYMDEGLRYGSDRRKGDDPATAVYVPDQEYGDHVPVLDRMGNHAVDKEGKLLFRKAGRDLTKAQKQARATQNNLLRSTSLKRRRDSSLGFPASKRLELEKKQEGI